jgi:hypothetical protein
MNFFGDRRQVRIVWQALRRGDAKRLDRVGCHRPDKRRKPFHHGRYPPAHHVLQSLRRAWIGHEGELDAGALAEPLTGHVRQRAAEIGCVGQFLRLAFGTCDEFGQRVHAKRIVGDNQERLLADQRNGYEALDAERQVGIGDRQYHQRRRARQVERVVVALGCGQRLQRDQPASTGPVEDQHLLAPRLRQPVGDDAGDHVGRAAGGSRHDHLHRLGRPALRLRGHAAERHQGQKRERGEPPRKTSGHSVPPDQPAISCKPSGPARARPEIATSGPACSGGAASPARCRPPGLRARASRSP